MAVSFTDKILSVLFENEKQTLCYLSYLFFFWGASVLISLLTVTAPYGRYSRSGWGFFVPGKFAWLVQELPSFVCPLLVLFYSDSPKSNNFLNIFALSLFLLHYFQRTFIFPFLIRGGKPTPLIPFLMALIFCILNGYMQGAYILKFADLQWTPGTSLRIIAGTAIFFTGLLINLHSDHILRNLRKSGETGYKIPYGGMFNYISGANFFGEMVEWFGFAILNWTLPTMAFSVFTLCNVGPRAFQHHRWYKEKFDDYPRNRKALIPFVL
ncbi:unnamed protein product [Lymnaea stagnalis]|uniref:3-oxo-5alpha-steroid 4-dehydrogenase (NADP(+)) n=1 Tax=Lymnaea stagnalis TaxID=6523 RepID=A0A7G7LID7_LYMST|nr:5 alpha-reductase [Lymnaea stagnalis]